MAKTKQDYINEGREAGRNNSFLAHPFREGSWQAQAWEQGWQAGQDERTDVDALKDVLAKDAQGAADDKLLADLGVDMKAVEATLITENVAPVASPVVNHHTVTLDPVMPLKAVPPKVVISHINRLHMAIATTTDEARRARLLRSVNRCILRWNRKLTA